MNMLRYSFILLATLLALPALAEEEKAVVEEKNTVATEAEAQEVETPAAKHHTPDPDLAEALVVAYTSNPQLEAQRRVFQAAVEQVPRALAGALPNVNAGYNKGRQRTRGSGTSWGHSDSELKSLTVSQPIFRGGTTYANTKLARRQVDAALARLTQAEQGVLLEAVTAYVDVVRARAVLDLSNKNRDVLEHQLKAASQRFEVGEDTRTDVAQSEARLALAKSEVINSKGQLESLKAVYREVIGELPVNLKAPENLPLLPFSLEHFVENAIKSSPLVKEAEALKASADYAVDANLGTLLPAVSIEGSMTRQDGAGISGSTTFDQDEIVLSTSLPLFQGGQRYSQIREAKENYQRRRFELLDVVNQVRRQAVSAWEELQASIATIESNRLAVEAAEVALEGVQQEQQYGSRTTLDVLDAERELFNAQVQLVIAKRNKAVAAYSVLAVLGQLTAKNMGLDVSLYDAEGYYDDTEYQFIGF